MPASCAAISKRRSVRAAAFIVFSNTATISRGLGLFSYAPWRPSDCSTAITPSMWAAKRRAIDTAESITASADSSGGMWTRISLKGPVGRAVGKALMAYIRGCPWAVCSLLIVRQLVCLGRRALMGSGELIQGNGGSDGLQIGID